MPEDVLARERASAALADLWSPERKVLLERDLWLAVLRAQAAEGVPVPPAATAAYEEAAHRVDLASIAARERRTRHDLKARIEEFNALAGHQHIHKGLTSCDITDNITQVRVRRSLEHLYGRADRVADRLDRRKRTVAAAESLRRSAARLRTVAARYPLRGLKGPVGTAQDLLGLFGGDQAALARVERRVARHLGFTRVLDCVGQVYPRSLDYEVLTAMTGLTDLPTTGRNRREGPWYEIRQLAVLLRGYTVMAAEVTGEQWNEGDVSCSVVRRVALPGAFFAADGVLAALERA
ncbi:MULTISPECIES: lyase family protein [Streptomyces]|uniref:adenylosuccinate lyase n=1 Tax=Streptomyces TaxID=1883 RepID=UPI00067D2F98|nr:MULTISPECIES: adenylosuccinate lyase [Streptomyces]